MPSLHEFTTPSKAVYLLVVPGYADWEPAHAVAELRRHGHYRVEAVGLTADPVSSMGGLTVLPTKTLSSVDPADVAVFILPGGDRWEQQPVEPELAAFLNVLDRKGRSEERRVGKEDSLQQLADEEEDMEKKE